MISRVILLVLIVGLAKANPRRVKFNSIVPSEKSFKVIKPDLNDIGNQTVLIALTIKNHAYSLPTFLATLEKIKCKNSKSKCDLW